MIRERAREKERRLLLLHDLEASALDCRLAWRRQLERLAAREKEEALVPSFGVDEHRKVRAVKRAHQAIHASGAVEMVMAQYDRLEVLR